MIGGLETEEFFPLKQSPVHLFSGYCFENGKNKVQVDPGFQPHCTPQLRLWRQGPALTP